MANELDLPPSGAEIQEPADAVGRSPAPEATRRLRIGLWLGACWLFVVGASAVLAPVLPIQDPLLPDFSAIEQSPSRAHWFGADSIGRDMFSRVIYGARASLLVGVVAVSIALVAGSLLGIIAGYAKGRVEGAIMRGMDVMLAFPGLVLALALAAFLGASVRNLSIAIGVMAIPAFTRVARSRTLQIVELEFIAAARSIGASNTRIMLREILPNLRTSMTTLALVFIGVAVVIEGALSFLGVGVPPPQPAWGGMIATGREVLDEAPHVSLIPSAILFLTVISLNVVADNVDDDRQR